ncbi:MAG: glycosyltransferase family 39 protein [Chloroflexota bacterium]|nr:glycosyltransferase family 39 protein [Chloroflexota bacterium]
MNFHWHGRYLWPILFIILANAGLAVPATRYGAAFVLLWLLPGLAWAGLMARSSRRPGAEEIAVGLGLGMGTVALLTLLLHYISGPLTLPALLAVVNVLIFTLIFLARRSLPSDFELGSHLSFAYLSLIIPAAAFFRLTYLGYSEFQGDEGVVMMRAARAILGDDAQLFYHQKGPAEILLPMATWTLSGTINEWQARLPFAFAGLLGVVALYLLGRRWFNGRSGQIAALLLAINGYFVGFGRVVQYQSIVLAVTSLALLALWRWSEGEGCRWLIAGAALLAFGLLAHYDAGLVLPTAAYIVGRRLWRTRSEGRALWAEVLTAGTLAFGIFALFYFPFIRHPNFAKTLGYLSGARVGTKGPLYNNLLSSLPLATFYNSTYYLIGLASLLIVASFLPFRRLGLLIPTACYILLILQSPISNLQSPTWVGPVLAGLLMVILLSRRSSASSRAAWLWFGAPFLFYYFLVRDPRTHVLNIFPGACLLASLPLTHIWQRLHASRTTSHISRFTFHVPLLFSLAILILLSYYPYLMFIQHDPEIKRTWPAHRPSLYWRPDAELPHDGYFGFPYRAGWKAVGVLIEEGVLSGVYASNEEQEVAGWYTRGAERTYCSAPEWYLVAKDVQDEVPLDLAEIEADYHLWGEVRAAGETRLWIYHQGQAESPSGVYHVEEYTSRFDAGAVPESVAPLFPADYTPAGYTLGDSIRLLGYRLDTATARPGGSVHLVLYWETLGPIETRYQVFNQLYDGAMWGQQDGTPGCALLPTVFWEPGQVVRDEYTIPIAPSTAPGDIPLLVGMYRLGTGERLSVRDPDGVPSGDTIPLAVVTVR